jgi:hypothetical protein
MARGARTRCLELYARHVIALNFDRDHRHLGLRLSVGGAPASARRHTNTLSRRMPAPFPSNRCARALTPPSLGQHQRPSARRTLRIIQSPAPYTASTSSHRSRLNALAGPLPHSSLARLPAFHHPKPTARSFLPSATR